MEHYQGHMKKLSDVDIKFKSNLLRQIMKYQLILIVIISIILGVFFNEQSIIYAKDKNDFRFSCPENQNKDIFLVGYILTKQKEKSKLKANGIKEYTFDLEEIGELDSDTPIKLRKYWKNKGVRLLSDEDTCSKIENVLSSNKKYNDYLKEFRRVYYKIDDKYFILYVRLETTLGHGKWPVQILDQNFKIVGDFKM